MWAMIVKEFRQVRRDRRTLAMMIVMPVLLLVVLGYAASFDVKTISVAVSGPQAELLDGKAEMAVVTGGSRPQVLIDGSQLFSAKAALAALAGLQQRGTRLPAAPEVTVLYNPGLKTSAIMIPGLCGVVLVFVGTIITSLGVVRERQSGTLEQLAVMPLKPRDV